MNLRHLLLLGIAGALVRADEKTAVAPAEGPAYIAVVEIIDAPAGAAQKVFDANPRSFPPWEPNSPVSATDAADFRAQLKKSGAARTVHKQQIELISEKRASFIFGRTADGKGERAQEQIKMEFYPIIRDGGFALFVHAGGALKNRALPFRETDLARVVSLNSSWGDSVPFVWTVGDSQREMVISLTTKPGGTKAAEKARRLMLREVKLDSASVPESLEMLHRKAKDADVKKEGINLVLLQGGAPSTAEITLELQDVTLAEALRYVAELAGMGLRYESNALVIHPEALERNMEMSRRELRVPDNAWLAGKLADAQSWFTSMGVRMPEGASAKFDRQKGLVTVKAVQDELDKAEAIILAFGGGPAQPIRNGQAWKRAQSIIVPKFTVHEASVENAVELLGKIARDNTKSSHAPPRIEVHPSTKHPSPPITLDLRNVPLGETLRYVSWQAHLDLSVTDESLVLESWFPNRDE